MSVRTLIRTGHLRAEVDHVDGGSEHLSSMRERTAARERQARTLREHADERHPKLYAAVKRRLGLLTR